MARKVRLYTKGGDDGTTGLLFGGRTPKNGPYTTAYGTVDEAQAVIGLARAHNDDPDLDTLLVEVERGLYVAMGELATLPENRSKLEDGVTRATSGMVDDLEQEIDRVMAVVSLPSDFVIPGNDLVSGHLDLARSVIRRAERASLAVVSEDSEVIKYLNRLSDLLWALARLVEGEHTLASTRGDQ